MDAPLLTADFKEFLKLLNVGGVEYLLVGGYAVGLHGYPRATTSIDGVDFETCQRRADTFEMDGVTIPVICLEDLKINKRAAGRHKDLADLENLP